MRSEELPNLRAYRTPYENFTRGPNPGRMPGSCRCRREIAVVPVEARDNTVSISGRDDQSSEPSDVPAVSSKTRRPSSFGLGGRSSELATLHRHDKARLPSLVQAVRNTIKIKMKSKRRREQNRIDQDDGVRMVRELPSRTVPYCITSSRTRDCWLTGRNESLVPTSSTPALPSRHAWLVASEVELERGGGREYEREREREREFSLRLG